MESQGELFAAPPPVEGFDLVEDVISPAEEAELARRIDSAPLAPFRFQQWEGKRLTMSYGSDYDYQRARPVGAPPMPPWLAALRDKLAERLDLPPGDFAQALLIRYDPGAGIGWHRDRPHYGKVAGLSLSAPARLRLRKRRESGFDRVGIDLPPRSLYFLTGSAREEWEHSIAPMDVTRRSITFRTLR